MPKTHRANRENGKQHMTGETDILAWRHAVSSIPEDGLTMRREANPAERAAIARELAIAECGALTAQYAIEPSGKGHYLLKGRVSVRVTQACVVTLDPVTQEFEDEICIEFFPDGAKPDEGAKEHDVLVETDSGSIENGMIDVGRLVFEYVSAGLDPYPRREGAEFQWTDPKTAADKAAGGPFAALAGLKDKED